MTQPVADTNLSKILALSEPFMKVPDRDNQLLWHLRMIDRNIAARRLGGGVKQCALVLMGASGSGKSKLLSHHLSKYSSFGEFSTGKHIEGSRMLWSEAPGSCNTKSVAITLLAALGIQAKSSTSEFELYKLLKKALKINGVDLVVVDEMQHVTRGALEATIKKVQDVLKSLLQIDDWPIHFIFVGTPEMSRFLEGDRQLANRCRVMRLLPINQKSGIPFVDGVIKELLIDTAKLQIGWAAEDNLQARLIRSASGAMGSLILTVREACERAIDDGRDTVTLDDFANVYRVNTGCLSKDNIFKAKNWEVINPAKAISDFTTAE